MGWKRPIFNGILILLLSFLISSKAVWAADVPEIDMNEENQTVTIKMIDKKRSFSTYFELYEVPVDKKQYLYGLDLYRF